MRRLLVPATLLVALFVSAPARAASLTIDSVQVNPNSEFTIGIRAVDFEDLFTFGFDLTFDAALLRATSITDGGFLATALPDPLPPDAEIGVAFSPGTISPGLVSLTLGSIFGPSEIQGGASGSGALAFVTFQALAAGTATLALDNVFLFDSSSPSGEPITGVTLGMGRVTVANPQPVPEPSTLALLGVGLVAVARKRLKGKPSVN